MRTLLPILALLALAGCATTPAVQPLDYVAQFNEPFLSYTSDGDRLTFSSPENSDGVEIDAARSVQGGVTQFEWADEDGVMTLIITPGQCFDDMAGSEYSHSAQLSSSNYAGFMGCARLTSELQPRESD